MKGRGIREEGSGKREEGEGKRDEGIGGIGESGDRRRRRWGKWVAVLVGVVFVDGGGEDWD